MFFGVLSCATICRRLGQTGLLKEAFEESEGTGTLVAKKGCRGRGEDDLGASFQAGVTKLGPEIYPYLAAGTGTDLA